MDKFSVMCPKCSKEAHVFVPEFLTFKNATLQCDHCYFTEKATDRVRYKAASKIRCVECTTLIPVEFSGKRRMPSILKIKCPDCHHINIIKEQWESYILKYSAFEISDPAFGLPFWYQVSFKGKTIWAYNLQHLEEIRAYVSAALRERTTDKFKMTMVEKLPEFIKSAKNRKGVLQALDQMKENNFKMADRTLE